MSAFWQRYKWWMVLVLLIGINLVVYAPWKKTRDTASRPPGPPGMTREGRPPEPTAEMKARLAERLGKMTPEERQAFEERRKADQAFFESIKDLPETERRTKMREHMAKNPPPRFPGGGPGGPGGPPPDGVAPGSAAAGGGEGSGQAGPGGDGKVRIPSADVRRGMDQQIANGQQAGGS